MLIWYGAGAVAAIFVAWVASLIHASGNAPLGLVSIGVGATLGVFLAKLAATLHIAGKKQLVIGTIILSILCILAEHTWLYLDFRRQWHADQAKTPQVAIFRPDTPWSPAQYFTHELTPRQGALWCLDATIIIGIAVAAVVTLRRESKP
jgi:ABC-type uncharacterized transport system permease subunit